MTSFSKPKPAISSRKPVPIRGGIKSPGLVGEEIKAVEAGVQDKEQTGKLDQKVEEGGKEEQKADGMRLAAIRKKIEEIKEETQQAREKMRQEEERKRQIREEAFDENKDKEKASSLPVVIGLPPGGESSSKPKSHLPPGLGAEKRRRR